jgi:O-antigen ligase
VTEIFRNDPNVHIRRDIYGKAADILGEHRFAGIGFGVIAEYLGTDGWGAGLNASNIFLEVWLGAGLIGFLAFVVFWFGLGGKWLYIACKERSAPALVLASVWIAATAFNLFNSGLFFFKPIPSHRE